MTEPIVRQTTFIERARVLCRVMLVAVTVFSVTGCATTGQPILHSLRYCNIGEQAMYKPKITYGEVVWPMTRMAGMRGGVDPDCQSGVAITHTMPVPESMTVEWMLPDGQWRRMEIPVRSRLKRGYAPHRIEVRFKDETVEVVELIKPTETTRFDHRLYP